MSPTEKQCWRGELCLHTPKVHMCSLQVELGKLRHMECTNSSLLWYWWMWVRWDLG